MPTLTIARGTSSDLDEVVALLQFSGLSGTGVAGQIGNFLIAREDGRVVAVAGLEDCRTAGLIRSVASHPGWRSRGLATTLVRTLIDRSRALGHRAVYLRTQTAEAYFARFGFRRIDLAEVAPEVLLSGQFQGGRVCPHAGDGGAFSRPPILILTIFDRSLILGSWRRTWRLPSGRNAAPSVEGPPTQTRSIRMLSRSPATC